MNNVVLVGRIVKDLEIEENESKKVTTVTIAVNRPFKNADGEYETDFIPCRLWDSIATNTCEYCKKGDVIGVKGKIQSDDSGAYVIAERVTFLSSKKVDEGKENGSQL